MDGRSKSLPRRRFLGSLSTVLVGATAGCSALDPSPGDPEEQATPSTERRTTTITTSERTTEPTRTTTPVLNRTDYPSVQQQTDDDALPEPTVLLSSRDWRSLVSTSALDAGTSSFLENTDFGSNYVAGFEVEVTEWGHHLRLEAIEQSTDHVRIEYSDVLVVGGPNVEQWRAMFVRLPRRGNVTETVTLHRTDDPG